MSPFPPLLKLLKQDIPTVMEAFFGDHTSIVVRPSMNHLIQFFDELSLWSMDVLSDEKLQFLDMSFDRLFTWWDDSFEAERISHRSVPVCVFPTGNCRTVQPRKSNPTFP